MTPLWDWRTTLLVLKKGTRDLEKAGMANIERRIHTRVTKSKKRKYEDYSKSLDEQMALAHIQFSVARPFSVRLESCILLRLAIVIYVCHCKQLRVENDFWRFRYNSNLSKVCTSSNVGDL